MEITARDMLSINSKKLAPKLRDAGSSILLSGPTIIRAIWGIIKPIQPTIPLMETAAEVNNVQPAIISSLNLEGFKPNDCASSSPIASRFICHLKASNTASPIITGIKIIISLSALMEASDPISQ